ncbi:RAQPRD family integrative conjugative element protein [Pseudomonas sp. KFB-139]|uniref:RAQPRD family integrative conjugative element protein n=1 Tax=Pseudomonas serbiensis TaxID=3064350 RepID=A0ABT9CVE8_9PSED|nr:RAQPRD family integrative conjugative element protein [Pseudomonas sp. KFB-138]MDO7927742.1 RAQPRD family integrative conjugative element protein [Pseudomonas sp. KFB-138]
MNTNLPAKKNTSSLRLIRHLVASALCSLLIAAPVYAAGTASERTNVEIMVRELNALEAVARRSAELPSDDAQRYRFDYTRLAGDIARIRQGLQDYLSPSRAQPRDATDISGSYSSDSHP